VVGSEKNGEDRSNSGRNRLTKKVRQSKVKDDEVVRAVEEMK